MNPFNSERISLLECPLVIPVIIRFEKKYVIQNNMIGTFFCPRISRFVTEEMVTMRSKMEHILTRLVELVTTGMTKSIIAVR